MADRDDSSLDEDKLRLRERVDELEETLRAIQRGEVDALVVSRPEGEQIYTLSGALEPYRVMVEVMSEGAATLSDDGSVLYGNSRFAELVRVPLEQVLGRNIHDWIATSSRAHVRALLQRARQGTVRERLELLLLISTEF